MPFHLLSTTAVRPDQGETIDFSPATCERVWVRRSENALAVQRATQVATAHHRRRLLPARRPMAKDTAPGRELAWHPDASDTAVGGLLVNIYIEQGDKAAAQRTLNQVRTRVKPYQQETMKGVDTLQAQIDAVGSP